MLISLSAPQNFTKGFVVSALHLRDHSINPNPQTSYLLLILTFMTAWDV